MSEAKGTDWEGVERVYRAGQLSVRAIGEQFGCSHTAVANRAKREGWQRDLTGKVRSATMAKVSTSVATEGLQRQLATEAEIVEEASNVGASIILAHRTALAHWRGISNRLCAFLASADINEDNHGDIARSLNSGVDAQIKVIKAERQAYNLDEVSDAESFEDRLARLMGGQ